MRINSGVNMLLNLPSLAAASVWLGAAAGSPDVVKDADAVRQVAIIGAGAAGSSAAYYLRNFADEHGVAVNITIFEKTDRIGGRTLTINPFANSSQRVELGASIFIKKNHIMYQALGEFGLEPRDPDVGSDPELGIWDGERFVFQVNENHSFWWNAYKVIMKYGFLAPRRTQKLMEATIDKFLQLYEEPFFPFRSLTQRTYELGLVEITGVTGEQLLKKNSVGDLYAHDIVQASTRVNYASNLAKIHGLDTMVSMAPEGAMAVKGGNWRIFDGMVKRSRAHVALNTSVVSIGFAPEQSSRVPRYVIGTESSGEQAENPVVFDNVILANPFQFSKISAADGVIHNAIDEIPYVQLHVTIFASPFRYSPAFFGLTDAKDVPGTILTTLGKDDGPASGAGKAGFFSISTLRKVFNPETEQEEYLYKIFSPEKVTSDFLSRLFGVEVPDSFILTKKGDDTLVSPISWYYPAVFHSYPQALPRVTFQDPIIGPGLYYTSGMESFISTMETNALMGKNVARLIVDDALGKRSGYSVNGDDNSDSGEALKVTCDRGRGQGQLEVTKTRPTEPVMADL
ncbi:Prenylcysteine oxidase [Podospora aff. communis PSN243]|uniref:Prenylcysteine oxidase n=1 Tax=Podospora aff. communis PSN243 TaxID=3040156 RepID=A0AAV9G704_9PEZI|nr:Prenylcysteine oxidase [Podospora aff. communis PSN243]